MTEFGVRIVTNVTKEYPNMIRVFIYNEPQVFTYNNGPKRRAEEVDELYYSPKVSSLNRTKSLVRDLVYCNDFELFCTFTFDPSKVDSFNYDACRHKMSVWIHHQADLAREKGKEFRYLVIPEQHKSGRWHFHALISGYSSTLKPSKVVSMSGRRVYNITSFRSGFTTAVEIDSREGVGNYVTKYITKDFIKKFNQRRFFASRNLTRPIKVTNSPVFKLSLPLFRRLISRTNQGDTYEICPPYKGGLGGIDNKNTLCQNGSYKDNVAQCIDSDIIDPFTY